LEAVEQLSFMEVISLWDGFPDRLAIALKGEALRWRYCFSVPGSMISLLCA
jgi:hypothetical protein